MTSSNPEQVVVTPDGERPTNDGHSVPHRLNDTVNAAGGNVPTTFGVTKEVLLWEPGGEMNIFGQICNRFTIVLPNEANVRECVEGFEEILLQRSRSILPLKGESDAEKDETLFIICLIDKFLKDLKFSFVVMSFCSLTYGRKFPCFCAMQPPDEVDSRHVRSSKIEDRRMINKIN